MEQHTVIDARFKNESVFVVSGPSTSGKTVFVTQLIQHRRELFRKPVKGVKWFYSSEGGEPPASQHIKSFKGLPKQWTRLVDPWDIVVLDDLLIETATNKVLTAAFTRLAHHKPCTLIYITQNLFHKSADSRTRSLNMHYLVMMKNPRDATQISHLARQMYPNCSSALVEVFRRVTDKPYSYLLFDFHQDTPSELRLRTNIFPTDPTHPVYIINTLEDVKKVKK